VAEYLCEPYVYSLCDDGSACILKYCGHDDVLIVPRTLDGHEVSALASGLFCGHGELMSVELPDTIRDLGHRVFADCEHLTSVYLSESLNYAGTSIFFGCTSLVRLTIPQYIAAIDGSMLKDCPISHLRLGSKVSRVSSQIANLEHLRELSIASENPYFSTDGVALFSSDGIHLVRLLVSCAEYRVPEGCIHIDDKAFDSVTALAQVDLPDTLESIGCFAFAKTSLVDVCIPRSVSVIAEKAFYGCARLARIHIPEGVVSLGEEAFAYTALAHVDLPGTLEHLGFRAFGQTPALKGAVQDRITIAANNRHLQLDAVGGLYRGDVFIELLGLVDSYQMRPGTRYIASAAFKWHSTLAHISLPEGVIEIGDEAFCNNRHLTEVRLPESLERIGRAAFAETSLVSLRLSARVSYIGEDALLVQGENQLLMHPPLECVDLDPDNSYFYILNGLLCERDTGDGRGDICILYVGPERVVHIPSQVTRIANYAFCGSDRIDEIYCHAHLRSICRGAFSTVRSIPWVHVDFPRPIDGYDHGDFLIPRLSPRYRLLSHLFFTDRYGTAFDFEYYDSWVSHATAIEEVAPAALARLVRPMRLSSNMRELYRGILFRRSREVCRHFARKGDMEAFGVLFDFELLQLSDVDDEIVYATHGKQTHAIGCLLEVKHRYFGASFLDLSL